MARLLNATGYVSSILTAVCLVLAVLAAPIGEARADIPPGLDDPNCTNLCSAVGDANANPPTCDCNGRCDPSATGTDPCFCSSIRIFKLLDQMYYCACRCLVGAVNTPL